MHKAPLVFAQTKKSDRIRKVQILGAKNFKERSVRSLIKTRPKQFYSENGILEDIKAIIASGNYEDAAFQRDNVPTGIVITFKVKEKAMIKKINFTGNKKIGKGKLKEEISLKIREGYDSSKLKNDVEKILSLYSEKGYSDATVEPFTTFDELENHVAINFVVKEGNRVVIDRVEFEGVRTFPQSKLRRLIKTKRRKVYNSETIKKDRDEIELFYKNNGFAKVKTDAVKIQYNPERTKIVLTIPVTEGNRYLIGAFEFSGQTIYTIPQLMKAVEMKPGKLYNQEKYERTLHNLRELYLEKGHLYSRIEPKEVTDPKENKINYHFDIDEGSIIRVDRIFIEGAKKTKEKVFLREILLKPGDVVSSSKLRRSQEKIYNLGFIKSVTPDIQPSRTDPEKVDLLMEIEEDRPGSLSAGAGFSSNDGLVGQIQLAHSNLFGLAQRLSLMWEFGTRKQNYEISWTEPWILNKPVSLGVDVYNTVRERLFDSDSSPDYTETRRGGGLRIGPRFSDIYSLIFSYSYNGVQLSNVKEQFKKSVTEGTNITSSLSTELIRDTRDYWFDASRGNRNSISVQLSGGPLQGDTHLVKSIFSSSWFWTPFVLGNNYPFVFSINGRFGGVQEYSPSQTVPIFERFFVGGADSVRGYQSRGEIGPLEGGRAFTVVNAEYKIPLYVENNRRVLQIVLFADMGGAWRGSGDIRFQFGESRTPSENDRFLKAGVGIGLRIQTPAFFPIRLDWGYGLNHVPGEDLSQIHFTFGNLF